MFFARKNRLLFCVSPVYTSSNPPSRRAHCCSHGMYVSDQFVILFWGGGDHGFSYFVSAVATEQGELEVGAALRPDAVRSRHQPGELNFSYCRGKFHLSPERGFLRHTPCVVYVSIVSKHRSLACFGPEDLRDDLRHGRRVRGVRGCGRPRGPVHGVAGPALR